MITNRYYGLAAIESTVFENYIINLLHFALITRTTFFKVFYQVFVVRPLGLFDIDFSIWTYMTLSYRTLFNSNEPIQGHI